MPVAESAAVLTSSELPLILNVNPPVPFWKITPTPFFCDVASVRSVLVESTLLNGVPSHVVPDRSGYDGSVTPPPPAATAAVTNAVVANRVVLLPAVCVGAVGLPVSAGE